MMRASYLSGRVRPNVKEVEIGETLGDVRRAGTRMLIGGVIDD